MKKTFTCSDTFIGSLCREVAKIQNRSDQLIYSIKYSNDKNLISRLRDEYDQLTTRKKKIHQIATSFDKNNFTDYLSIEFLIEISSRNAF